MASLFEAVMNLVDFATQLMASRDVSPMYAATFVSRARGLENHVGRPEIAACLTEDAVNRLLAMFVGLKAPSTIKGWRGDLLTMWNAAADDGLVGYPVLRRIRRIKVPATIVECYTLEEARQLLRAAEELRGGYPNGVGRKSYWTAIIRVAWDTGLRRGDCWRFGTEHVQPDGRWRIVQSKTGAVAAGILHESTRAAMASVPLAWPLHRNAFTHQFRRLVQRSVNRGTFRWLRRASGSYVEAEHPGRGHAHLGHADVATFKRHYDAQLAEVAYSPPEL